jgi:hypothetical protein
MPDPHYTGVGGGECNCMPCNQQKAAQSRDCGNHGQHHLCNSAIALFDERITIIKLTLSKIYIFLVLQ